MKKVLLIEDDMVLREATVNFLEEEGFLVFSAKDGMLGIKSAMKNLPDLILCDIEMPNFNGYEVYSILQENVNTRLIPFIFLTARAETEDIRAGMQKGVDDYITKPFDYDELLKIINIRIAKRERILKATIESSKILFENSVTGVFVITGRKFAYINNKFTELLGYTLSDLNSQNWISIITQDDKRKVLAKVKASVLGVKKIIHVEFRAFTKNRKLVDLKVSAGQINYKGRSSFVGYLIVKEKKQTSENLMWLDNITDTDLDKIVKLLEENQELLSSKSIEKLKKVYKNTSENEDRQTQTNLTERELEVLDLFCKGKTKHEIGEELFLSVRTVERHRARLIEKTQTNNTVDLVLFAIKNKLVKFELD